MREMLGMVFEVRGLDFDGVVFRIEERGAGDGELGVVRGLFVVLRLSRRCWLEGVGGS